MATETSTEAGPGVDLTGTTDAGPAGAQAPSPSSSGGSPKFGGGAGGAQPVPNEWVVALQPFADLDEAEALTRGFGGDAEERFRAVFEGFVFRGPEVAARRLAEHPRVREVTTNAVVEASADSNPTGVRRIQADQARAAGATGSGQRVVILDTGIDLDHPDLNANIEASRGKNCVSSGRSTDDDNGHGTHVAGIVAEADGSGVVGAAPGAKLVPVKVLGSDGKGSFADVICGIGVLNLSRSGKSDAGSCTDGFVREAICTAVKSGIVVVAAAGNDDANASSSIPARFPEVITVSALDDRDGTPRSDRFASFSNYGTGVDVIAPGFSIVSTRRGGGTETRSGTSMAAPHVAGAAALDLADGVGASSVLARLQSTGECPNATFAGSDKSCSSQGTWSGGGQPGNVKPTVDITSPSSGAELSGNVTVEARVDYEEDSAGDLVVTYTLGTKSAPLAHIGNGVFRATVDTNQVADGTVSLGVTAKDSDGVSTSDTVQVAVVNDGGTAPGEATVDITDPDEADQVDGRQTIAAKVSGVSAGDVDRVEYRIDNGAWLAMSYRSKKDDYKASWKTTDVDDGEHTVTVRAVIGDETSTSPPVTVEVSN